MSNSKLTRLQMQTPVSITTGANKGFGEKFIDLHQLFELLSEQTEGRKVKISNLRCFLRIDFHDNSIPYWEIQNVIVQTSGTFTDTPNLTERSIDEILDVCIDDEFGYQKIGNPLVSQVIAMTDNGVDTDFLSCIKTQFNMPRNILNILNKELSTEKLQTLYWGMIGNCTSNVELSVNFAVSYDYDVVGKAITIR